MDDLGSEQPSKEGLLSTKKFAEVCRTTVRTVQFYDKNGLLKPYFVDKWTKYRYYKPTQARNYLIIRFMENFHIPLAEIKELLKISAEDKYLKDKLSVLNNEIEEKEKELRFLSNMRSLLFDNLKLNKVFNREVIGPYHLFCLKVEHGSYDNVNIYRQKLRNEAEKLKIAIEEKDIIFYVSSNYKPKDTPLEFALICKKDPKISIKLQEDFYFREMNSTKALVYNYQGPNNYFIIVYQRLFEILEENKIKLKSNEFDINMDLPDAKLSFYDYRTKLVFPI